MTTWPLVEFTDAPSDDATVLFDCQLGGAVLADSWTLGTPEPLEDGTYSQRRPVIPLRIEGSRAYALARQAELAKVLLRREFYVRFQLDGVRRPVWLDVRDASPGDLSFDRVYVERPDLDVWEVTANLTAEAMLLRERVTLPPITLSNDPVAATNPQQAVLPEIEGDAPAPVRLDVTSGGPNGRRWLWSVAPCSTAPDPVVWDIGADSWTVGADTSAPESDTAYSGGSYRTVSFSTTPGLVSRISGVAPSAPPAGQYLVAVRVVRVDADSRFMLRWGTTGPTAVFERPSSTLMGQWVLLGEHRFPRNTMDPPRDLALAPPAAPTIDLQVSRLSGGGSLRLDAIRLIPVRCASSTWAATTLRSSQFVGGARALWDGDLEAAYLIGAAGRLVETTPAVVGGWPTVTPGAENLLTMLTEVDGGAGTTTDSITEEVTVTCSYHPRTLWLGDGTEAGT